MNRAPTRQQLLLIGATGCQRSCISLVKICSEDMKLASLMGAEGHVRKQSAVIFISAEAIAVMSCHRKLNIAQQGHRTWTRMEMV